MTLGPGFVPDVNVITLVFAHTECGAWAISSSFEWATRGVGLGPDTVPGHAPFQ